MQSKAENHTMRVFYLLAIVFVVDGHTTLGNLFDMNGLFRYYSFHLMMFAFGSGYFFRFYGGMPADLAHRAKKLLVPLYLWNAVYGVGAALLRRFGGFELGEPLSAYTLLLAPLADGQHFVWNLGSWFIFPLFLAQIFYAGLRRLSKLWHENEVLTFLLCLIPGCAALSADDCGAPRAALHPIRKSRVSALGLLLFRLRCVRRVCRRRVGHRLLSAHCPAARAVYREKPSRDDHQSEHVRYHDAPLHGLFRARLRVPRAKRVGPGRGGFQRPRFPHTEYLYVCARRKNRVGCHLPALRPAAAARR